MIVYAFGEKFMGLYNKAFDSFNITVLKYYCDRVTDHRSTVCENAS